MGHQGTGPVLIGTVCRGEGDNGEKMEGTNRGTEHGHRLREWHRVMRNKWKKMAERRRQTRGEEHQ
jgi:hypothetical protein